MTLNDYATLGAAVGFRRIFRCVAGMACIALALGFVWRKEKNARTPRWFPWVAVPFYILVGFLMLYWGLTGNE
jgi:hypothetical protein